MYALENILDKYSMSSSEYSDVYNQVGGSCWVYTSANVVMRFISMVLYTYDLEDGDILMRKKKTETPIHNLEEFIEHVKENNMDMLDIRQCFYFFLCMVAVDSDYYVKLIKKGVNFIEGFDNIKPGKYDETHKALHNAQIYKGRASSEIISYILNFLKKCKSINPISDVFERIVYYGKIRNLNFDKVYDKILYIITTFNKYVIDKKLRPTVAKRSSRDKRGMNFLKKALNQNMYCAIITSNMDVPLTPDEVVCLNNAENYSSFDCHAMTCVGYLMNTKQLVVKNSWGTEWCEGGVTLWSTFEPKSNPDAVVLLIFINSNLPEHKIIPDDFSLIRSYYPSVELGSRDYAENQRWYDIKKKFASIFKRPSPAHETILDVPHKNNLVRNSPTKTLKKYSYKDKVSSSSPSSSPSSPSPSPSSSSSSSSSSPSSPSSKTKSLSKTKSKSKSKSKSSSKPVESHDTMMTNLCEKQGKEYIKKTWKTRTCSKKCLENQTRNPKTLRCIRKEIIV